MVRSAWPVLGVLALVGGCVPLDVFKTSDTGDMPVVNVGAFGTPPAGQTVSVSASAPPGGNAELALHLDCIGRKVNAANRDTGLEPKFATIGTETPEIFHQGTLVVYVTEGLIKQCKTEGEIAALLCLELGKMASSARRPPTSRLARRRAGRPWKCRSATPASSPRWTAFIRWKWRSTNSSVRGAWRRQPRAWPASISKGRATPKPNWTT